MDCVDAATIHFLYPLLVVSVAVNQVRPMPTLLAVGKLISISSMVLVIALVVRRMPFRVWPLVLIGVLLITRGARLLAGETELLVITYTGVAAVLCSAAGAYVATVRPDVLPRQFAIMCALAAPVMIGQVVGIEQLHVLRTDIEYSGEIGGMHPTLFVQADQIVRTGLQSRPSGLMYANNVMSFFVLMGLGLHFGRARRLRPTAGDVAVLAVVVLLMAKITLLGLAVLMAARMFCGREARIHTLACAALLVVMLGMYRLAFPGLFVVNLAPEVWIVNLQTRLADLLLASGVPALVAIAEQFPVGVLQKLGVQGATQSGYAQVVEHGPTLLPTLVVSVPYFWMAFRKLRRFDRETQREVFAVGLMACLSPLVTANFGSLLFWFVAGTALRPLWALVEPAFGPNGREKGTPTALEAQPA